MKPTQKRIDELMREHGITLITEDAYKFAALAYEAGRKDENEECGKICDAAQLFGNIDERWAAKCCADQIRARKEQ